ncbi:MAG: pilin [Patescibacteria group bacterium]
MGKTSKKIIIFAILAGFLLTMATPVLAQSDVFSEMTAGLETVNNHAGLPKTSLKPLVGTIIKQVLSLLGIFTLIIVMYGGFLWMVSGGNEDRKKQAKGVFTNGLIGLVIILLAYSIVSYVFDLFQTVGQE